jgi:uracil-DNA glycosylase
VFKAFDRLRPRDVRAVIIGQDPYTKVSQATGRAFEQGDIGDWSHGVTKSMKSLLLTLATERTGDEKYFASAAWPVLRDDLEAGVLTLPPSPTALFDAWEDQGLLLLNAGLTLSHYKPGGAPEQVGHIQFWSPVIERIIQFLVSRENKHLVFLGWGKYAQNVVKNAGVTDSAAWKVSAAMSEHPHPAAITYWTQPNPLSKASTLLESLGGGSIVW